MRGGPATRGILRSLNGRRAHVVADERGIALVIALMLMVVLAITTAAIATLVTSNETAFGRDREEQRAINIGEAGINAGLAYLNESVNDLGISVGTAYPSSGWNTASYDGGTYQWKALKLSQDSGSGEGVWKVTAIGTAPTGSVSRQLTVQTKATTTSTSFDASQAWAYGLYVASPTGCTDMLGSVAVTMKIYVRNDLCMNGGASILEPSSSGPQIVTVYVGGRLMINGGPTIGQSTRRILSFLSVGGCKSGSTYSATFCGSGTTPPGGTTSKVWASDYNTAQPNLSKPTIDADGTYASGDWDAPVCSTGSFTFDTNGTRDTSVGDVNFMPNSSYDCTVYTDSSHTTVRGRLAWDKTAKALIVQGTVYIDGNMKVTSSAGAYTTPALGAGAIGAAMYFNGSVQTNGNSALCGPPATVSGGKSCSGLWSGPSGALSIIAVNAGGAAPGWKMNGNAEWNVLAYVVGAYEDGGTAVVTGPIITDTAKVHGTPDTTDVLDPPAGTPGAAGFTQATAWGTTVNGSWTQEPVGTG